MSSPSALTAILRTQSYPGLNAINRELCDNRITREGGKDKYVQRLRRSLKNSLDNEDITWADILEVLSSDNAARTHTRIKNCLDDIVFSKTTSYKDGRSVFEHYATAEVFQALHWKFRGEDIEVRDEEWKNKDIGRPDLTVIDGDDKYVIEVKTPSLNSMEKLKEQVRKYRDLEGTRRVIVLYVTDNPRMTLDSNTRRKRMIGGLKGHYDDLTIIEKGPDSFYTK